MRVMHVDTETTWRGGEQQVAYLVRGLLARGHDCVVIAPPDSEIARRLRGEGVPVRGIPMRGELDPLATLRLAAVIRALGPDIVHMHTAHAHTLGVAASRIAGRGRRVVSRRVDFEIGRWSAWTKYRHGVDRFIAITEAVANVLRAAGVPDDRISIARSGVDPDRLAGADAARGRAALGIPSGVPLAGCVAHLTWHKGQKYVIQAWPRVVARLPEARLVLVGAGEDLTMLRDAASSAGVADRVVFVGFRDDVPDCLAALDCFVLPSVLEGMGTSLLDAMVLGVPVVASRVGGIPEIVEDGVTGRLVPPREPDLLASAVIDTLLDRESARTLAGSAQRRVRERFTADRMVEATLNAYGLALAGSGGPS